MNANENNSIKITKNQEAYEGIKQVMLQDGAIPKEILKYSEGMQEKEKWERHKDTINEFSSQTSTFNNIIKSIDKQYSAFKPITTPIKIIVKRIDGVFKIIDLVIEYQANGKNGVLVKIGDEIIANIVFSTGAVISSTIATELALALSVIDADFGCVVGFFLFSNGIIVSDWLADESKTLVNFAYEYIYLPTKDAFVDFKNGLDYLLSGNWFNEFIKLTLFGSAEGKKVLEYELRNQYGDDGVDDMDEYEKNIRMLMRGK